jgi:hypothetical protein
MPRTQLPRREVFPDIDIDAVTAGDPEGLLGRTHHGTDALVHGIDQMDAGHVGRIRTRHPTDQIGTLCRVQARHEAVIAPGRAVDGAQVESADHDVAGRRSIFPRMGASSGSWLQRPWRLRPARRANPDERGMRWYTG